MIPWVMKRTAATILISPEINLPWLLSWAKKGSFAVLDQGLFAGANFLTNILLARWMEPTQYGAFAIAHSVFLLLASFHAAVLTEPMLVFGPGKYAEKFKKYLGILFYGHCGITGAIAVILLVTAMVFRHLGSQDIAGALMGLSISAPFILLMSLARHAFYVRVQPQWAATGGGIYVALLLAGISGLYLGQWLSPALALVAMGIASLAVSLWLSTILRPQWRSVGSNLAPAAVLRDHWGYGHWSASAVVLMWFPNNIYYVTVPIWVGLDGAAALRVITTFVMPILNIFVGVSNLLFPVLARQVRLGNASTFYLTVRRVLKLLATASIVYFLLLLTLRGSLLNWLYGDKYQNVADLLLVMGLSPFSYTVIFVLGTALRAIQHLHQIVWCYTISSLVSLTVGFWLMTSWGVLGATLALVISTAITAISIAVFYNRLDETSLCVGFAK
jgi:O-antigen/teichoic acid export membrane protein